MLMRQKIIRYIFNTYNHYVYRFLRLVRNIRPYKSRIILSTGTPVNKNRSALFSIHLEQLMIAEYLKLFCKELDENGYDVVLIVTFNNLLNIDSVKSLLDVHFMAHQVLLRKNYGKDFGSFKDGLKHIDASQCDDIILLNDSMIGPLFTSSFMTEFDKINGDVIGITDSYDIAYHLQSSFLKFSGKDNVKLLNQFFDNYAPTNNRDIIIRYGEVNISQFFKKNEKNIIPYVSTTRLWSDSGYINKLEDNAQHAYWSELVFKYKVPFIKRELIVSDPSKFLKFCDKKLSDESLNIIDDGLKYRIK